MRTTVPVLVKIPRKAVETRSPWAGFGLISFDEYVKAINVSDATLIRPLDLPR